ncbi:MAG TPA: SRPBCC family protein [Nitrospiraceae bacterium]|nr:SRPBCC family protein [Nitrospiraceae bacterium]
MAVQTMQPAGQNREQRIGIVRGGRGSGRPARLHRGNGTGRHGESKEINDEQVARALGWFSIGLGLAEILAPRELAKFIGVPQHRLLFRLLGVREMTSGIGILTQRKPAGWMWSRVIGDAMDLALLGAALTSDRARSGRVAAATGAVVGVAALDWLCSRQLSRSAGATTDSGAIRVKRAVTVDRSPEELYRFWHDVQNLPRVMSHLQSVQVTGEKRSHWVAKAPAGRTVEWDAEITYEQPNQRIAWRSIEGADVDNMGSVQFQPAPGGRGTEVHVELEYSPPGGMIGAAIAKLFGESPDQQIQEDLRRFKRMMEAGEIPTTKGQPQGAG